MIRGREAAERYEDVIQSLAVPISEVKTHVSKDTYEFAKRWYKSGVEITPFPILSFVEANKR